MVMKFYANPYPNGERAILPLFLADVDPEKELELVLVNIMGKQQLTPAYKAKNVRPGYESNPFSWELAYFEDPFGAVPYLEDGELTLFESRAIAKYIVEKYNLTSLVGTTPKERATINQWAESEAQNFHPTVAPLAKDVFISRRHKRPVDEKLKATGLKSLGKVLDVYEAQLSEHKYLAGDRYTLADVFHTPFLFQMSTMDVFAGAFDNRPHVKAWVADITSHPAFLETRKLDWDHATPFESA